jgi:hypothetical protein
MAAECYENDYYHASERANAECTNITFHCYEVSIVHVFTFHCSFGKQTSFRHLTEDRQGLLIGHFVIDKNYLKIVYECLYKICERLIVEF